MLKSHYNYRLIADVCCSETINVYIRNVQCAIIKVCLKINTIQNPSLIIIINNHMRALISHCIYLYRNSKWFMSCTGIATYIAS